MSCLIFSCQNQPASKESDCDFSTNLIVREHFCTLNGIISDFPVGK